MAVLTAKSESERTQQRISAGAEREKAQIQLQIDLEQARAMAEQPMLWRLRQIEALQEMARKGGKFAIGLRDAELSSLFDSSGEGE